MKVWITRDFGDKTYEVWGSEPCKWEYECYQGHHNSNVLFQSVEPKKAKKIFKLDKHLKKKEILEATMTFKIKT